MHVVGNVLMRTYQDVVGSQKISSLGVSEVSQQVASSSYVGKRCKARIKFKKIRGSEKVLSPEGLPEEYYYVEKHSVLDDFKVYFNVVKNKSKSENFFMSGLEVEDSGVEKYFSTCYLLMDIKSPEPNKGAGTEAMQGLVEKSFLDKETEGRVIVYVSQISPADTCSQFFYKLGFRYVDERINIKVREAIERKLLEFQLPAGYMYLPKENIQKLLRYGHLF